MKYEQDERQVSGLAGLAAGQAAQLKKPSGHLEQFHERLDAYLQDLIQIRLRMERHLDQSLGDEPQEDGPDRERQAPACMLDHINQDLENIGGQINFIRYQVDRLERI